MLFRLLPKDWLGIDKLHISGWTAIPIHFLFFVMVAVEETYSPKHLKSSKLLILCGDHNVLRFCCTISALAILLCNSEHLTNPPEAALKRRKTHRQIQESVALNLKTVLLVTGFRWNTFISHCMQVPRIRSLGKFYFYILGFRIV